MPYPSGSRVPRRLMAILSVVVLSLVVFLPPATLAQDGPTSAELRSAETLVMRLINQERSAVGLRAIRTDGRIRTVAQARSRDMVDRGYFDHVDPDGKLPWDHLDDAHITWYGAGEIIAWNTVSPIDAAAAKAVSQWMHSTSGHREQILSTEHNYAGVGVATDGARSIWTVVFIQGPDRTDPIAALTRASSAQGSAAISLAWSGSDPLLVTRTAGIASFDLARRKPGGTWTTIKSATTRTSLTLTASAGARYQFRVRARDKAGNVGDWSATRDVTVR